MLKLQIVPEAVAFCLGLKPVMLIDADDEDFLREADLMDKTIIVAPSPLESYLRQNLIVPHLDSKGFIRNECRGVVMNHDGINYIILPESKEVTDAIEKMFGFFSKKDYKDNVESHIQL